jgi:DNA-directed RNA polymerase subunit M/transcription elongation factor TFIIS
MNYCPYCNNLLVPNGNNFKCRICNREFKIADTEKGDFKEVKSLKESKDVDSTVSKGNV